MKRHWDQPDSWCFVSSWLIVRELHQCLIEYRPLLGFEQDEVEEVWSTLGLWEFCSRNRIQWSWTPFCRLLETIWIWSGMHLMRSDVAPWKPDFSAKGSLACKKQQSHLLENRKEYHTSWIHSLSNLLYQIVNVMTLRMEARLFRFWDYKQSHMPDVWNHQSKLVLLRTSRISCVQVCQKK